MTEMTLLDLAAKIEAALPWEVDNSPHFHNMRAVDVAIARAVRWDSAEGCGRGDRYGVPAYSASLDAAMTLMADEWGYEQRRPSEGSRDHYAKIWWVPAFPSNVHGKGKTPALALTAASLRARHALDLSKGSDV